MSRPAFLAATACVLALGAVGYVLLRPHDEPSRQVHVLRREPVPVTLEGPAALSVSTEEGLFARYVGGPADASLRMHLLTPLPAGEECTEHCPPGLTVEAGAPGVRATFEIADSLAGRIEALAAAPGMDPEFQGALRAALDALERKVSPGASEIVRVLLVRGGIEETLVPARGVGIAVYDTYDKVFDANRTASQGGVRILINRLERPTREPRGLRTLFGGAVEVSVPSLAGSPARSRSANSGWIRMTRTPLGNHFLDDPAPVAGIAFMEGRVAVYGLSDQPRLLAAGPKLLAALAAVLRSL